MKQAVHAGGHHHNMIRSAKNKDTHKYEKQAVRTAINKDEHKKKAKELKDAANHNKEAKKLLAKGDSASALSPHGCSDLGCD